jgi:Domain of unknown function (DUF929)
MANRTRKASRSARSPIAAGSSRNGRKARLAAAQRARRRNRTALAVVGGFLAIVLVMVAVAALRSPGASHPSTSASRASELAQSVPASVLTTVGPGMTVSPPQPLPSGTAPLERDGKPEVLYIGAEYCPYCAAERWPLVVALARFGHLSNLGGTESSATDVYPRTQTFTFHGADYSSDVLSFVSVETNTNQPAGSGYTPLESTTAAENALLQRFDREPYTSRPGVIPFLLIGNRYVSIGASYDPTVLQGLERDQIAEALSDPTSPIAKAIDGSANTLTAAICTVTDNQPASVCSDPAIAAIAAQLPTA